MMNQTEINSEIIDLVNKISSLDRGFNQNISEIINIISTLKKEAVSPLIWELLRKMLDLITPYVEFFMKDDKLRQMWTMLNDIIHERVASSTPIDPFIIERNSLFEREDK